MEDGRIASKTVMSTVSRFVTRCVPATGPGFNEEQPIIDIIGIPPLAPGQQTGPMSQTVLKDLEREEELDDGYRFTID